MADRSSCFDPCLPFVESQHQTCAEARPGLFSMSEYSYGSHCYCQGLRLGIQIFARCADP